MRNWSIGGVVAAVALCFGSAAAADERPPVAASGRREFP